MRANILLVEHAAQAADFLKRNFPGKNTWVAVGPSAMAFLDARQIAYAIPEDFYKQESLQQLCETGHRELAELCRHMDQRLEAADPELKTLGLQPFLFNYVPLVILLDSIRSKLFQLLHIVRSAPGATLCYHTKTSVLMESHQLYYSNQATLWGHVASLPGWQTPKESFEDPTEVDRSSGPRMISKLHRALRDIASFSLRATTFLRYLSKGRLAAYLSRLMRMSRQTLLVLGGPGEWWDSFPALEKLGYGLYFAEESFFQPRRPVAASEDQTPLWPDDALSESACFQVEGISVYPLVMKPLKHIVNDSLPYYRNVAKRMDRLLRTYSIQALLTSGNSSGLAHVISQSVRRHGKYVFTWQHGQVVHDKGTTGFNDYNDRMTADYALVYGEGTKDSYSQFAQGPWNSKVIPMGSSTLDHIQTNTTSKVPPFKLLYATTNYYMNHWNLGMLPGLYDTSFYRDQITIVDRVQGWGKQSIKATIKLRPATGYIDPPWANTLKTSDAVTVINNETTFADLLRSHNVILLDFPSTTVLQSLASGAYLFVLLRYWKYPASVLQLLTKRCICRDTTDDLLRDVERLLTDGKYEADLKNDEFLKAYGTYRNDGLSGRRAASFVHQEILSVPT